MVTVKSSQKIFTDSEVASLTGICVEHLHNFAKSKHLGFIARAAEAACKVIAGCKPQSAALCAGWSGDEP